MSDSAGGFFFIIIFIFITSLNVCTVLQPSPSAGDEESLVFCCTLSTALLKELTPTAAEKDGS